MTELTDKDVTVHPTSELVTVMPLDHPNAQVWSLTVAWRGRGRYAVLRHSMALSRSGTWDYECVPSEREDEWLADHRFEYGEAVRLAIAHAPHVVVNGMSASQVLEMMRADAVEGGGTS